MTTDSCIVAIGWEKLDDEDTVESMLADLRAHWPNAHIVPVAIFALPVPATPFASEDDADLPPVPERKPAEDDREITHLHVTKVPESVPFGYARNIRTDGGPWHDGTYPHGVVTDRCKITATGEKYEDEHGNIVRDVEVLPPR